MKKVLFILKRKETQNPSEGHIGVSTGLYNSASFMDTMLVDLGVNSQMVIVTDNNDIDREVTKHRPSHVIIEALWVVPSKFAVLQKLHPTVTWIIRLHSEMPFLAGEGMAMDWLGDYSGYRNIVIACNSPRMTHDVKKYLAHRNDWEDEETNEKVIYLPNYYPTEMKTKEYKVADDVIHIGCFGAIRPLKNQLSQAHAALEFAKTLGKKLVFHINSSRIEQKGDSVMNNFHGLFQQMAPKGHVLTGHVWTPRDQFLELCAQMDIGMQVTFSETFNIVGADIISQGVPLVGSIEIPWAGKEFNANPVDGADIYDQLMKTHADPINNVVQHQQSLIKYVETAKATWGEYFKE